MNYIDKIVNLIIRPTRDQYHTKRLGDPQISIYTSQGQLIKAHRQDRVILNKHNQHVHLSYYAIQQILSSYSQCYGRAFQTYRQENTSRLCINQYQNLKSSQIFKHFKVQNHQNKCVIYLHANNGSRIQGLAYLQKLLQAHLNVCLFDCSGSGMSQGQYVTLGLKQSRDLDCVVNFLMKEKKITQIFLWGRSMGAATALIYGSKHSKIKISGIILDSPFKDLQKLIVEIASDKTGLPKIFFQPLIPLIRSQILNKTGYNIEELKLKKYIEKDAKLQTSRSKSRKSIDQKSIQTKDNLSNKINNRNKLSQIPALFIVSKNDKFVFCSHGQKLFKRYRCQDKQIMYIDTEHHGVRQQNDVDRIINYIVNHFNLNDKIQQQNQQLYPLRFTKNVLARSRLETSRRLQKNQSFSQVQTKTSLNKSSQNHVINSPSFELNYCNNSSRIQTKLERNFFNQNHASKQTNFYKNSNQNYYQNSNDYSQHVSFTQQNQQSFINYSQDPQFFRVNQPNFQNLNQNYTANQSENKYQSNPLIKNGQLEKILRHQKSYQSFSSGKSKNQMSQMSFVPQKSRKNVNFMNDFTLEENQQQITPHYLDRDSCAKISKAKISLSSLLAEQQRVKNNTSKQNQIIFNPLHQQNAYLSQISGDNLKHSKFSGWINENTKNFNPNNTFPQKNFPHKNDFFKPDCEQKHSNQPYLSLSKVSHQFNTKYKSGNEISSEKQCLNSQLKNDRLRYNLSLKSSIIGHFQMYKENHIIQNYSDNKKIQTNSTQSYRSFHY